MRLTCPKCRNVMEQINYAGVLIDRCTSCRGLWFDNLEKEDLKRLKGAESIDIGDEFVGATFNELDDSFCPRCNVPMSQLTVDEPYEIRFEICDVCHGNFFDAGEFRDYMEEEIFEQFEALVTDRIAARQQPD